MKPVDKGVEDCLHMANREGNEDELRAQEWLRQQEYRDIRRPCSDPPDFVVDGVWAVEVTRLNQRLVIGNDGQSKGVEQVRKPLACHIKKIIDQLGPPGNEGYSWLIDCEYDFSEGLPNKSVVTRQISEALKPLLRPYDETVISAMHSEHFNYDKHAGENSHWRSHLCLDCGICLQLIEFSHKPAKFILNNVSDGYGIAVAAELGKSIQNRILDKSTKVRNQGKVGEYRSWWLVLVDHVCHAPMTILSEHELSFVRDQRFDFWSRVTIISSRNPSWHYELLSR